MITAMIAVLTSAVTPTAEATPAVEEAAQFPEIVPVLMQSCIVNAVERKMATETDTYHKYICSGLPADLLWQFLERANLPSYEQAAEGAIWLSREFPMGGCFKRIRFDDGRPARYGLSCTIGIPRADR